MSNQRLRDRQRQNLFLGKHLLCAGNALSYPSNGPVLENERQPFQSNRVRMGGRDPGTIASAESYKTFTPNEIWASVPGMTVRPRSIF